MRLDGKVAAVIGAGQTPGETIGNGRATAVLLAREGARVMLVDRRLDSARETQEMIEKQGGECFSFEADITSEQDCRNLAAACVDRYGRIDLLHNNVGIGGGDAGATHLEEADWDHILDVNLKGCFLTCKHVLPVMREQQGGSIVNISSIAGWIGDPNPERGEPAYSAAKAALFALTRNIAAEVGPAGVRCNAIAPGLIWSKFVAKYEEQFQPLVDETPLRRFGTSEDIVEAVMFLASDRRSGFITGEALNVSGGWYMRP